MIKVVPIEGKGRGVVATEEIDMGTVLSVAPILEVVPNTSIQHHYWADWNGHEMVYYLTLGVQTLVNHSVDPNCISFMHEDEDFLVSIKRIDRGEELTLNYFKVCDEFDGTF